MSDEDAEHYEMLMPFVTVKTNGGPFDDRAYVAGYEAGVLDAWLEHSGEDDIERYVHSENVPQLDLVAMHRGYTMTSQPWDEHPDEWTYVRFVRTARDG